MVGLRNSAKFFYLSVINISGTQDNFELPIFNLHVPSSLKCGIVLTLSVKWPIKSFLPKIWSFQQINTTLIISLTTFGPQVCTVMWARSQLADLVKRQNRMPSCSIQCPFLQVEHSAPFKFSTVVRDADGKFKYTFPCLCTLLCWRVLDLYFPVILDTQRRWPTMYGSTICNVLFLVLHYPVLL